MMPERERVATPAQHEELRTVLGDDRSVRAFLDGQGFAATARVELLEGGVSSVIVRVEDAGRCLVLKQASARLRVAQEWLSRPERSSIEAGAAVVLDRLVPGSVPRVVTVLPDRHAFAMTCAPAGSVPWKAELLRGTVDPGIAGSVGTLLGRVHAGSAADAGLAVAFGDRSFFDELRLDPYFRAAAARHADLAPDLAAVIAGLDGPGRCLVHGDFSPKNLLVTPERAVLLVDHEVAHWGHPAFDLGFVLAHLVLKSVHAGGARAFIDAARAVLDAYRAAAGPDLAATAAGAFGARVLGGLLLARVDGKSPVEYLTADRERDAVRGISRRLLSGPVASLDAALEVVERAVVHA